LLVQLQQKQYKKIEKYVTEYDFTKQINRNSKTKNKKIERRAS